MKIDSDHSADKKLYALLKFIGGTRVSKTISLLCFKLINSLLCLSAKTQNCLLNVLLYCWVSSTNYTLNQLTSTSDASVGDHWISQTKPQISFQRSWDQCTIVDDVWAIDDKFVSTDKIVSLCTRYSPRPIHETTGTFVEHSNLWPLSNQVTSMLTEVMTDLRPHKELTITNTFCFDTVHLTAHVILTELLFFQS